MDLMAKATAVVGGAVAPFRRAETPAHQAMGPDPQIPKAKA